MVKIEEINDNDWSDAGSDASDVSDVSDIDDSTLALYDPNQETLAERIAALKDIIPPTTRLAIADTFDSVYVWTAWGAKKAGSAAWVVTTSALLVGLPLMLSIEGEAALVQQEKEYLGQTQGAAAYGAPANTGAAPATGVVPPGF